MRKTGPDGQPSDEIESDEILPEYDFSESRSNEYASRYSETGVTVTLDPDVADVFPGAKEANEALRALADLIRRQRARETTPR